MTSFKVELLALLLSCTFFGCTKPASREEQLSYLRAIMPESLLEYASLEIGSAKNAVIVKEGKTQHLRLGIFPGQAKVNKGMRSEVSVDYPYIQGDTVCYSWRFMLPKDFVCDAPKNRWWIIGQWHDQPNVMQGESWETFSSRSPPVLLGLGELEGRPAIGFTYGPTVDGQKQQSFGPIFLERGKWHSLAVVIRWSQGADGKATVFLDDHTTAAISVDGPNMNNDYQHYLKLGMYRHPAISTENWITIGNVEITKKSE